MRGIIRWSAGWLFVLAVGVRIADAQQDAVPDTERFGQLQNLTWSEAFHDPGTQDWQAGWFLDGTRASVTNTPQGMLLTAGPIARDHASHCVLWTKQSFSGDVKIEFDYWRMDTIQRWVNILYIQATGSGDEPFVEDIGAWSDLRQIPYMRMYYDHMNLLHISFAAFDPDDPHDDYVRVRRYPTGQDRTFKQLAIAPDYFDTQLFTPGVKHHFTVIKRGHELVMHVTDGTRTRLFRWDTAAFEAVKAGRIGFRHMFTRSARYANIIVSVLTDRTPVDPR